MAVSEAEWNAFERGQNDARENRPRDNKWPTVNPCHFQYELGYDEYLEVMYGR
ncbi:hypothetical protein [Mesorhizobium amorphae]|uniref:hypothetical protein n=1 Tax=Mesorhizobium amorphae TaxID=71433 RepID=UPI0016434D91|nr:hypothetical protein [Mesorhizobium amorphae]